MIPISYYLILSTIIFTISIAGIFINRKNILVLLMSLELMFLSVNSQPYYTWETILEI